MKSSEIEMAEFLEVLKAPQSRRILEKLAVKEMTLDGLMQTSRLSEGSIRLHLEPLISAKLVLKRKDGLLRLNKAKFDEHSKWFINISTH